MIHYSAERFQDGSVILFLHCRYGIIPYIWIKDQTELEKVITMLQDCQDRVPDVFREALDK